MDTRPIYINDISNSNNNNMVIYYFRQPDNKKEEYFMYKNTSLTRVGEVLVQQLDSWDDAVYLVKELNKLC